MDGPELFRCLRGTYGNVVLHGSPFRFGVVEPRQCLIESEDPLHKECGVYGSQYAPISLLYSIIHENRSNWGWRVDFEKSAEITVTDPNELKGGVGYLYVLPKTPFTKDIGDGVCCIAYEPITPIEVLEVHPTVLEYLQKYFGVLFRTPTAA